MVSVSVHLFPAEMEHADTIRYLGVPAHIADAYDPRRDTGTFHLRGGWVKRHGKCLAPVQDLDHPAIERPDLRATISETNREIQVPTKETRTCILPSADPE